MSFFSRGLSGRYDGYVDPPTQGFARLRLVQPWARIRQPYRLQRGLKGHGKRVAKSAASRQLLSQVFRLPRETRFGSVATDFLLDSCLAEGDLNFVGPTSLATG